MADPTPSPAAQAPSPPPAKTRRHRADKTPVQPIAGLRALVDKAVEARMASAPPSTRRRADISPAATPSDPRLRVYFTDGQGRGLRLPQTGVMFDPKPVFVKIDPTHLPRQGDEIWAQPDSWRVVVVKWRFPPVGPPVVNVRVEKVVHLGT